MQLSRRELLAGVGGLTTSSMLGGIELLALQPAELAPQSAAKMAWLRDAKFGMFIHWGLYAGPGRGEWLMHNEAITPKAYEKYARPESGEEYFSADQYDAKAWATLAKNSGMKWMCLTARHHDGFCLFDCPHPNAFTSIKTHKRDFVKEYVSACRAAGLKVGLYFSPLNWRHPGYYDVTGTNCAPNRFGYKTDPNHKEDARLMKEENYVAVKALVKNYGKIDHIFWDGGWLAQKGSDADGAFFHEPGEFLDPKNEWPISKPYLELDPKTKKPLGIMGMVRRYQPDVLVNPRYGWTGDYGDEEGSAQVKGRIRKPKLMQKCMTTAGAWGYDDKAVKGNRVIRWDSIVEYLSNCVVRDMVLLLNVGPDRHGVIPSNVAEELLKTGKWLNQFGEAIYGTRGGPFEPVDGQYGFCTKGKTLYIHIQKGFKEKAIDLPAIAGRKVMKARQLGSASEIMAVANTDGSLRISGFDRTGSSPIVILSLEFGQRL